MLYRHFPKISNKEISTLILAIPEGLGGDDLVRFIRTGAELGINAIDLGADARRARAIRERLAEMGLSGNFILIGTFTGTRADELDDWLATAGATADDWLLVKGTAETGELARAARDAGKIAQYGFYAPADAAEIVTAADSHDGWEFCSFPYNYVIGDLDGAFAYVANCELAVLATDPLAGGKLEAVPAATHEIFRNAPVPRAHDEWAFRAIWERQEIAGISFAPKNADQLTRLAIYAAAGRANSLPSREIAVLEAAAESIRKYTEV
jgi:predicted aldo/keto reductase-like oxidoreductase